MSPAPRLDPLSDFGFLLKDVGRLYTRNFERRAAVIGLTLERCRVLINVRRHEGLCQAKLAELSEADPMTLGRLLVRMEVEGLVERHDDPNDGRAHRMVLGAAAKPLLTQIDKLSSEARADALAGLATQAREALAAGLQHVRTNLDALLRPAGD